MTATLTTLVGGLSCAVFLLALLLTLRSRLDTLEGDIIELEEGSIGAQQDSCAEDVRGSIEVDLLGDRFAPETRAQAAETSIFDALATSH